MSSHNSVAVRPGDGCPGVSGGGVSAGSWRCLVLGFMTGQGGRPPPGHWETPESLKLSSGRMNAPGEPMVLPESMLTSPWNGKCPAGGNVLQD